MESARWGDAFTSGAPYTLNGHWIIERDRLLHNYFPQRSAVVLQQFRNGSLYPSLAAPRFNQHGGVITAGFQVTMTGPANATIWYMTDGSDPRLPGGAVAPTAVAYVGISRLKFGPQAGDISTGWMRDGRSDLLVTFPDPTPDAPNEIVLCGTRRYSAQNSIDQPIVLQLFGTPGLGRTVIFTMQGAQANAQHLLAIGLVPGELPIATSTSQLMMSQGLALFTGLNSGTNGNTSFSFTIPPIPVLVGQSLYFQDWSVLGNALVGSNGLEIKFCR